ncbi:MAG: M48 family metalloprotease [Gammaproteobacteria bacterium]|nr:M48 family metalloprotease [Gammaproteobacteria bacterium]MDH5629801.1 M48 family metalloprotease [Gammaproteobacteria bacterium]
MSFRKLVVSLLSSVLFVAIANASSELPNIGSSSSRSFSLIEEQAVGDDYMRQIRAFAPIVNDAEINDYIQHLGFKLVENTRSALDRRFSFFLLADKSINAFALPGGYIGIHTGLLLETENESELASVVSHEIAHVTQRHLARRIEMQNQMSIPTLAAFLAAILIAGNSDNSDAGMAAMAGASGLAQQAIINHTRSNESEADRIGIATLYKSGFDPYSAVTFFEKMQQNQRYYGQSFEFLSTHPLSRTRITDARLRAANYPKRKIDDNLTYQLMKEKVKALTVKVTAKSVDDYNQLFKSGKITSAAERYGYAIFLIRAEEFKKAEAILKKLQAADHNRSSYAIALAELDLERKTPKNSINKIKQLLMYSPTNQALVELLAQLYLKNNQADLARELLLSNIHMTQHAPYLLNLLAESQEKSGHFSEAYETAGNYLLAMGDLNGAKAQFEQALYSNTADPYSRSRINAQIINIKEVLHQRSLRR